jgi:hypothetical protein
MPWPDLLAGVTPAVVDPAAVATAAARVRSYCQWHIAPSYTETVTVEGPGKWVLKSLKITAVTSITDVDTAEVLTSYAAFDGDAGVVWLRSGYRPTRRRRVAINVTHGHTVCPDDVVAFVRDLANSGAVAPPIRQATVGSVSVSYSGPLFSALDGYRLASMA